MKYRPLQGCVVVRRITTLERSAGGIIIADMIQEKPMEGDLLGAIEGAPSLLDAR
ncbi:MAG TPA: hypothetical protein VKQ29_10550 [Aliidongia sp.]|nr:hypothetical protein [Aliidongia sp.]